MAIASSRLGLRCVAIGHVGDEIYGDFLIDVLRNEGINMVEMNEEENGVNDSSSAADCETLLCWVLVDPLHRHGFCRLINLLCVELPNCVKTLPLPPIKSNVFDHICFQPRRF